MEDELIYDGFRKSYSRTYYYANSIKLKPTRKAFANENTGRRQIWDHYRLSSQENPFTANENLIKLPNQFGFNEQVCTMMIMCVRNRSDSDRRTRKFFTDSVVLDTVRNHHRYVIRCVFVWNCSENYLAWILIVGWNSDAHKIN